MIVLALMALFAGTTIANSEEDFHPEYDQKGKVAIVYDRLASTSAVKRACGYDECGCVQVKDGVYHVVTGPHPTEELVAHEENHVWYGHYHKRMAFAECEEDPFVWGFDERNTQMIRFQSER